MSNAEDLAMWTSVDRVIDRWTAHEPDAVLGAVVRRCRDAGLPDIAVSPSQGRLLQIAVMMCGATRALEVGTLGGYSTICLARGMPSSGKIVTLEVSEHHAAVARENFADAGVAGMIDLRVGPALETLSGVAADYPNFDLIFIDADKPNNPGYLRWALSLAHSGTVIIVDNVVRHGAIAHDNPDESTKGAIAALRSLGEEVGVVSTAVQTVGAKGHDGFAIAVVR